MDNADPARAALRTLQREAFECIPLRLLGLTDEDTVASLAFTWRGAFEILAAATVAVLLERPTTPFTKTALVSELNHERLAEQAGIPVEKSIHLAESLIDALFAQAASGHPPVFLRDGSGFRVLLDRNARIHADRA